MLLSKEAVSKSVQLIKKTDFYSLDNQIIFQSILNVHNAGNIPDLITVSDDLTNRGKIDDIGGHLYLTQLSDIPTTVNFEQYIKILLKKTELRNIIKLCNRIEQSAYDEKDPLELQNKLVNEIYSDNSKSFTGLKDAGTICNLVENRLEKLSSKTLEDVYLFTGFQSLDALLGGIEWNNFVVLAGRPGIGKSAVGGILAVAYAEQGYPVLIESMEMPAEVFLIRVACGRLGILLSKMKMGHLDSDDWTKIYKLLEYFSTLPLFIFDKGKVDMKVFRSHIVEIMTKTGKPPICFIDHMQIVERHGMGLVEALTYISGTCKVYAMEFNTIIYGLSQLNREVEYRKDKRPIIADLRQSGSIEQDADIVHFLFRDEFYNPASKLRKVIEHIIAKNRNGIIGNCQMHFNASTLHMKELPKGRYEKFRQ